MRAFFILALGLAVAVAGASAGRIVGGSITSISQYPYAVSMLLSPWGGSFSHSCGGSIINNRGIVTAAHCVQNYKQPSQWNFRVGSTNYNSGGVVHTTNKIISHGSYSSSTLNHDIAVIHINGVFSFNNNVAAVSIAGSNYNLPNNAVVWVAGWGAISFQGPLSVQIRHADVNVVNQSTCQSRYAELGMSVTNNMVCAGLLDIGGRDACQGDSGGPLVHNKVLVGITSWGFQCAVARYPGVYARVSQYTSWIQNNA